MFRFPVGVLHCVTICIPCLSPDSWFHAQFCHSLRRDRIVFVTVRLLLLYLQNGPSFVVANTETTISHIQGTRVFPYRLPKLCSFTWVISIRFILSTGIRIRIDSMMRPRSSTSSRGRNTSTSVTVTVTVTVTGTFFGFLICTLHVVAWLFAHISIIPPTPWLFLN